MAMRWAPGTLWFELLESYRLATSRCRTTLLVGRDLQSGDLSLPDAVRCYLTRMRTTISTKGQIVLPAELRAADDIKAGEEFEVDRVGPDEYRLTRLTPPPNRGLVDWLRSCPEDGWFVEIESESTDSL
jgi:AbrB family looped-hinge helix DNA binding protein